MNEQEQLKNSYIIGNIWAAFEKVTESNEAHHLINFTRKIGFDNLADDLESKWREHMKETVEFNQEQRALDFIFAPSMERLNGLLNHDNNEY